MRGSIRSDVPGYLLLSIITLFISNRSLAQSYLYNQLNSILEQRFAAHEPGGAVLVLKGEQVVFAKGYGVSDIKSQTKITPNTVFNTGSISKTFVANAILISVERGKLSLDDPLIKYFDDFDHPEIVKDIRIEHLLSHTSGLPDIRKVSNEPDFFLTAKDGENFEPLKKRST